MRTVAGLTSDCRPNVDWRRQSTGGCVALLSAEARATHRPTFDRRFGPSTDLVINRTVRNRDPIPTEKQRTPKRDGGCPITCVWGPDVVQVKSVSSYFSKIEQFCFLKPRSNKDESGRDSSILHTLQSLDQERLRVDGSTWDCWLFSEIDLGFLNNFLFCQLTEPKVNIISQGKKRYLVNNQYPFTKAITFRQLSKPLVNCGPRAITASERIQIPARQSKTECPPNGCHASPSYLSAIGDSSALENAGSSISVFRANSVSSAICANWNCQVKGCKFQRPLCCCCQYTEQHGPCWSYRVWSAEQTESVPN